MQAPPSGYVIVRFGVTQKGDLVYSYIDDSWEKLHEFGTKTTDGVYARRIVVPNHITEAHRHCRKNKSTLETSNQAGCFHCVSLFSPTAIKKYVGKEGTEALCPNCGIDSVLPEHESYELTTEFLQEMCNYWFKVIHPSSVK